MMAQLPRIAAWNVTVALVSFLVLILDAAPQAKSSEGTAGAATKLGTLPVITIQVQTPDGKPLPKVTVVCIGPSAKATLNGTAIEGGSERMQTDAEGRFRLTLNGTNLAVAVAAQVGFNFSQSRDLANNSTIIV